jgi:hypothetical protein
MSIQIPAAGTSSVTTPIAAANTGAERAVRLPSFDEVMAELMLEMAIRDISRKADARRQRRQNEAKDKQ